MTGRRAWSDRALGMLLGALADRLAGDPRRGYPVAEALLAVALAPLAGGDRATAWRTLRRDGAAHPSPNAGRMEAAFAGALGVRLVGAAGAVGLVCLTGTRAQPSASP